MFDRAKNELNKGKAQRDQEMVAPYKNIDWVELEAPSLPSLAILRSLQSFRDKVVNGVREFPLEVETLLKPLLDKLKIDVHFTEIYRGHLDPEMEYGSKLTMEDLLGPPIGCEVYIDKPNFLKLKNIHFK